MKKLLAIFLLMLFPHLLAWSNAEVSAFSKVLIKRAAGKGALRDHSSATAGYQAFIGLKNESAIEDLKRMGVTVNGRFDGFVAACVPGEALKDVAALDDVSHIALARPMNLCNDTARILSRVGQLHEAAGMIVPLTGKGVIVGVVDIGIDFNHINLCDSNGRSRVRAVYMPCDSTGTAPVINGDTLPGSCYLRPEQIEALTTDYALSSHGTHTLGTAVGSCKDNHLHGMAPDADIVACGIPSDQLTDVNIANAVRFIFNYADQMDQPCVINMSIGCNDGPNDGSSYLCRLFEQLSGPGRICVLSAGNDGNAPVCFHDEITGRGDTVTTLLRNHSGGLQRKGYVSMWSDGSQVHRSRLVVINRTSGLVEYASPIVGVLPEDSIFTLSSDTDAAFSAFYEGEIEFASAMEPRFDDNGNLMDDGRFHTYWAFDVTSRVAGHLLGIQYMADEPDFLSGWCTHDAYFYTFGLDGVTGGTSAGSISDLTTTDAVISVGAYCSRDSYRDRNGVTHTFASCNPGDIAAFSSFGPDENGKPRPDLCAPGMVLLSSANRYDEVADRQQWLEDVTVQGELYPYYANQGTSMSAPVVTGTVALMLQVNPRLTPADVRAVLQQSSRRDACVINGNEAQWGAGKLDAVAAIDDVVAHTIIPGDVNNDLEVSVADVMALVDVILSPSSRHDAATMIRADVNRDQEIQLSDVNCVIDLILNH